MKKRILPAIITLILAMAGLALAQTAADAPNPPKIVIKETTRDLGEIKQGNPASHTFTFKNEGKSDLQIKNVAPS